MLHFLLILVQLTLSGPAFGPEMSQLFINNKYFSGSWELSNLTTFNDTNIFLSPSNSTTGYGYAWRLCRIPNTAWNGLFKFRISNISSFAQIGIYLTKKFAVLGDCFGGPCNFYGLAVLVQISNGNISFEVRKNNYGIDFTNSTITPEATFPLDSNEFSIKIEDTIKDDDDIFKIYANIKGVNSMIFNSFSPVPIRKNWISITSNNNMTNNEISMTLANLSFTDEIYNLEDFDDEKNQSNILTITATEFDPDSNLTNKDFKMISRVITYSKKNNDFEVDTDSVLEGILEISRVLEESATVKKTNKIIEELLHPYTDSWKRRSYFIVNQTSSTMQELKNHLVNLKEYVSIFRNRTIHDFSKLNESIIEIEQSLLENVKNSSQVVNALETKEKIAKGTNFVRFISYFSIIEVIVAIITIIKIASSSQY